MSVDTSRAKILKGKYQITKNSYVVCYLHILDANNDEVKTLLKIKSNAFTEVPVGTTIYFSMGKDNRQSDGTFNLFSVKVKRVDDVSGNPLHVCTAINKASRENMRAIERRPLDFPVKLSNSDAMFTARDGHSQGLTLQYTANHAMMSLILDRTYDFSVNLKDTEHLLPGKIKHIHYDWQTHQHVVGVHFSQLNKDQDIILNLLVDPDYVIPISNNASVDTAAGKISLDI